MSLVMVSSPINACIIMIFKFAGNDRDAHRFITELIDKIDAEYLSKHPETHFTLTPLRRMFGGSIIVTGECFEIFSTNHNV